MNTPPPEGGGFTEPLEVGFFRLKPTQAPPLKRAQADTGRLVKELVRRVPRLHLLRFPGYAPELNPDEGVWKLAKGMLVNGCPKNRSELNASLTNALQSVRHNRKNLRACIDHSGLPCFLP